MSSFPMIFEFKVPVRKVTKVFLHCSASDNPKHDNPETIDNWHRSPSIGFREIGYHFFINQKGEIFRGRDQELIPAAQRGHNTNSLAICCSGLSRFSDAQMNALKDFCRDIYEEYLKTGVKISFHGHCEVEPNKTCPVYDYKTLLKLNKRGFPKF